MIIRRFSFSPIFGICIAVQFIAVSLAHAQWPEEGKLVGPDTIASNFLGLSAGVSGDVAVVGASGNGTAAAGGGAAYVFRYNADTETWDFEQQLFASDAAIGQAFGDAVAISGDVIAVGALGDSSNGTQAGAAYVFRYDGSTWTEEQKLLPTMGSASDRFGTGVSVSGSVVVVGADGNDDAATGAGASYVFRYDGATWSQEQQLTAPSAAMDDVFGEHVSIDGDVIAAGKYGDSDNGALSGAIHIYRYDGATWNHEQKVTASDGAANDFLGRGVSVSGDVVVGTAESANGKSYVYRYDGATWNEEQILTAPSPAANGMFGQGVSVSGDTILAGESGNGNGQAHAYRYNGTTWVFERTIEASDGISGAIFGFAVGLSGDAAIVGAALDTELGVNAGAAYAFRFTGPLTNSEEQVLTASNASNTDRFGEAVSVYGDVAIAGTLNAGTGGIAYVYRYNGLTDTWDEEQIINNPGISAFDAFGSAVSVFGDVAIIGAKFGETGGSQKGIAYIYRYDGGSDTWLLEHTCIASDAASNDNFGDSVAIHGDVALIGGPLNDLNAINSGSAYVFRYDESTGTWQEEQKLAPVDTLEGDRFGSSVSIWGDVAVVGAIVGDGLGVDSGAFYVFRYDGTTWVEEQRLVASDGSGGDQLGESVAIYGDTILVGALFGDGAVADSGKAYVFRFNGDSWVEEQGLFAANGAFNQRFGAAVSLWGDTALIGTEQDSESGSLAGAAYLFRYNGSTWIEEEKLLASDGTSNDSFGYSVSVFGDVSVVGAPVAESGGSVRGQAYVFRGGSYTNTAPVADPGGPYLAECRDAADGMTTKLLNGTNSFDLNKDEITYNWTTTRGTFDDNTLAQPTIDVSGIDPRFDDEAEITLEVSDGITTHQQTTTLNVRDTQVPDLTLNGDNPLFIECNVDTYVEPGATAFDACAGVVNVTISGDKVDESTLGTYVVRYNADDPVGNGTDLIDREVIVRDTTPPTVTLNGDANITLECGVDTYTELSASVTDACDDSVSVVIGGDTVDESTPGVYTVTYDATDVSSNAATQVTRTVTVQDTLAPTVALVGDDPVILTEGDTYTESGAIANDTCDGNVTASIVITGSVNTGMAGSYVLTYTATDAANNSGQTTRTVNVLADTEAPIITLDGANPLFLNVGETFDEPGFSANDAVDGDITGDVVVTGSVDTQTPGDYVLTYSVSDSNSNSAQAQRTVTVLSTSNDAPVITLTGGNPLELVVGDMFTEPGFGASDTEDNALTGSVIVTGSVNTAAVGSYILTYSVTDSDNNTTQVQRIVNVSDVGAPVITLSGANPQTVECGPGAYTDPGFSATDDVDGNVTGSVIISGDTVDSSTPGSYTVIYTVSDSSMNTTQTSRIVNVVDTTAPILSLVGDNPLSITQGDTFSEPGFSALDVCEGDLAGAVAVTGSVDTGTIGSYELTYTVSDNAGNQAQVVRTVNVVAAPTDVNEDGVTNSVDIQTVINIVLGIFTGTADVNNDGMTNSVDIQLVINAVLGI